MTWASSIGHIPEIFSYGAFFIDGPGGTGKSFLYHALLAAVRSKGFVTLATMTSDDEVVKLSLHARAIKDIGNEELRNFFYKMAPWQFILLVSATSVGEELFFTAAVQFILTVAATSIGEKLFYRAAVQTGVLLPYVPFAKAFATLLK
ncbi:hypothetical protein FXO38_04653 [Capsicum annuum]|nr:hypothetical protein FXO37_33294 [Capsicum annuum]KAF3675684.1 hypothetical protein FXO38_04653 [Capsicum annuum]